MKIILASASPRRKELLKQIVETFDVIPSDADETQFPGESPEAYVARVAKAKAEAVAAAHPGDLVIGADTAVVLGATVLGKPASREDAVRMLSSLSGREHRVLTGVCVIARGVCRSDIAVTRVVFNRLSPQMIDGYLNTHAYLDKAGAYGIQDIGNIFVASHIGEYDNVVGLPVALVKTLTEAVIADKGRA